MSAAEVEEPTPEGEPESEPTPEPTPEPSEGEPEPEPTPEPEPEPSEGEPEPEQQPEETAGLRSEAEIEKAQKQVEQLRKSVADRVGRIFGDDAGFLVSCPLCAETAPGWLWPADAAPLSEAQTRAVFQFMGVIEPKEYQPYSRYARCDDCAGLGSVKTGSRVPGFDVVDCPTCARKGYNLSAPLPLPQVNGTLEDSQPVVTGMTVMEQADADDPAVAELRRRGFTVVPPIHFPG